MRQGNNAKWALAVAALVVLVAGGLAMGSNMGFKFNMPIDGKSPGWSAPRGDNWLSIPYLVPYTDKQCLCEQMGLPSGTTIQQFSASSGVITGTHFCDVTATCGAASGVDGSLVLRIVLNDPNPTNPVPASSAIVVGAHDPAKAVRLFCPGTLPVGDNWVSLPYHTTAVNRQDICDEIPGTFRVSEFSGASGALDNPFICGNPGPVNIQKGRSVKIELLAASAACTGPGFTDWVPNHF